MNPISVPKARVLIVDRNEDLRELFSHFFEYEGFEVRTTANGSIALTIAAEFAPDVVFSSLRIDQLDGYALAKELRKLPSTRGAVLVAMSAYGHESADVLKAGFNHYLSKPIALENLTTIIKSLDAKAP